MNNISPRKLLVSVSTNKTVKIYSIVTEFHRTPLGSVDKNNWMEQHKSRERLEREGGGTTSRFITINLESSGVEDGWTGVHVQ